LYTVLHYKCLGPISVIRVLNKLHNMKEMICNCKKWK